MFLSEMYAIHLSVFPPTIVESILLLCNISLSRTAVSLLEYLALCKMKYTLSSAVGST